MARTGRPPIEIDWKAFDKLCFLQCTDSEIAAFFECDKRTLASAVRRDKKMSYCQYYAQKAEGGKISLRRLQFQSAQSGDRSMQIWLGKQWLGQTDKPYDQTRAELLAKQLELMSDDKHNEYAGIQLLLAALGGTGSGTGGGDE